MSHLRRYFRPGEIYFMTAVTYRRLPILLEHLDLLQAATERVFDGRDSSVLAWVVLPDHFHYVVEPGNVLLSDMMHRLKMNFAGAHRKRTGQFRGRLWQHRYWDHIIRDDSDLERLTNYIHYNPVKHGYADSPENYSASSYREFDTGVAESVDWGEFANLDIHKLFGE